MPVASLDREFGLLCPKCESHKLKCYDSRPLDGTVRRYRQCLNCLDTFVTHEVIVRDLRKQHNSKKGR